MQISRQNAQSDSVEKHQGAVQSGTGLWKYIIMAASYDKTLNRYVVPSGD